jgi:hypothetical protein
MKQGRQIMIILQISYKIVPDKLVEDKCVVGYPMVKLKTEPDKQVTEDQM